MPINRVEIPGKAMLFGEYAVLVGGTAALYPVPRYLILWERNEHRPGAYTRVISEARKIDIPEIAPYENEFGAVEIDYDNSQFYSQSSNGARGKLGLGLSSAEAVGVVSLRLQRAGLDTVRHANKIAEYALRAHRHAQTGEGSGADIYCCAQRKALRYKIEDGHAQFEPIRIDLSERRLPVFLVYTGQPSDSRKAIASFNLWLQRMTTDDKGLLKCLIEISQYLSNQWPAIDTPVLFDALDEYTEVMKTISDEAGLHYWTDVHTELDRWARKYGGRAKPVGAGGGDMALMLGRLPIEEILTDPVRCCIDISSGTLEKAESGPHRQLVSKTL